MLGYATFPGVGQILSARYALTHGISPGVAELTIAPQVDPVGLGGTLAFHFGAVSIFLAGFRADLSSARFGDERTWNISLLDKRWRWKFGEIYGEYNVRDADGNIDDDTRLGAQALAELLLDAMGEPYRDVSALDEEYGPHVIWDGQNTPAEELSRLCEAVGCVVVLKIDGEVSIEKVGQGATLPDLQVIRDASVTVNPPEKPGSIRVLCKHTQVQARLELEAVGLDFGGEWKLLDELTYAPDDGWETEPYYFPSLSENEPALKLAKETVWRAYRVKFSEPLIVPEGITIESLEQILPIKSELVEMYLDEFGRKRNKPARVVGIYWLKDGNGKQNSSEDDHYEYPEDFRVEGDIGIVRFSQQVVRADDDGNWLPAELYLDCSFSVRSAENRAWHRYAYLLPLSPDMPNPPGVEVVQPDDAPTLQLYEARDDIADEPTWEYVRSTNQLDAELLHYAQGAAQRYDAPGSADVTYNGLIEINPDGAIRQVAWEVGPGGTATRAARNSEALPYVLPYRQKRAFEKLAAAVAPRRRQR